VALWRNRLEVGSWAFYDFANTIFAINILSYHFPLWLTVDIGLEEWKYAFIFGVASFLAALGMPLIGYLSDRSRSRQKPLIILTMLCVFCTLGLGFRSPLLVVLILYCLASIFYHNAQVMYNAQIIQLAQPGRLGSISGIGVGVGYLGTIFGVWVTRPFFLDGGHAAVFIPTALLFILFAFPCLVFCRDRFPTSAERPTATYIKFLSDYHPSSIWRKLKVSQPLFYYACFSFMLLNVAAIVVMFMTVFAKRAVGLTEFEIYGMILCSASAAVLGSIVFGWIYDRWNPLRVIGWLVGIWLLAFVINIAFRVKGCFFVSALLVGAALGATWSVTRVHLLKLIKESEVAEYYGIFGLLGRVATLTGPFSLSFLFWCLADYPGIKYDILNVYLLILVSLSGFFLYRMNMQDS